MTSRGRPIAGLIQIILQMSKTSINIARTAKINVITIFATNKNGRNREPTDLTTGESKTKLSLGKRPKGME